MLLGRSRSLSGFVAAKMLADSYQSVAAFPSRSRDPVASS
jgi:hypothetical protein